MAHAEVAQSNDEQKKKFRFAQKKFYLKLEPIPGNGIQLGSLTTSNYSHVIDF